MPSAPRCRPPGGLGGVEAALTFSFGAAGVPAGIALSATLLYRALFYWLRIPLGAAVHALARQTQSHITAQQPEKVWKTLKKCGVCYIMRYHH